MRHVGHRASPGSGTRRLASSIMEKLHQGRGKPALFWPSGGLVSHLFSYCLLHQTCPFWGLKCFTCQTRVMWWPYYQEPAGTELLATPYVRGPHYQLGQALHSSRHTMCTVLKVERRFIHALTYQFLFGGRFSIMITSSLSLPLLSLCFFRVQEPSPPDGVSVKRSKQSIDQNPCQRCWMMQHHFILQILSSAKGASWPL